MAAEEANMNLHDGDLRARIVALEQWRVQRDIDSARHDERWKNMDDKIEHVGKKVDKIASDISRVVWLILIAIIGAVMAFLIRGGFS